MRVFFGKEVQSHQSIPSQDTPRLTNISAVGVRRLDGIPASPAGAFCSAFSAEPNVKAKICQKYFQGLCLPEGHRFREMYGELTMGLVLSDGTGLGFFMNPWLDRKKIPGDFMISIPQLGVEFIFSLSKIWGKVPQSWGYPNISYPNSRWMVSNGKSRRNMDDLMIWGYLYGLLHPSAQFTR